MLTGASQIRGLLAAQNVHERSITFSECIGSPFSLILVLCYLFATVGCSCNPSERIVDLGNNYVLYIFSEGVRIENMSGPGELQVPAGKAEIGWNERYIVVKSLAKGSRQPFIWVLDKSQHANFGPITEEEFDSIRATNWVVKSVQLKPLYKAK